MKKVVHVVGALISGGAEVLVARLAIELSKNYSVTLLVLSPRKDSVGIKLAKMLELSSVNVYEGPSVKIGIKTLGWYQHSILKIKPDIVHLHTPNTEMIEAFTFKPHCKYSVVRTVHNTVINNSLALKIAYRVNCAKYTVSCGDAVSLSLNPNGPWGNQRVIQNGIYFEYPINELANKRLYKKMLGLDQNVKHFVSIGRMARTKGGAFVKGQDVLINAVNSISDIRDFSYRLHFLGDGDHRHYLQEMAKDNPNIIFHGVRGNIQEWLLAADFFVLPSLHEGMPIAAIEALGYGLPCIFTNIPALRNLSPHCAKWVEVGAVEETKNAFVELLRDSGESLDLEMVEQFRYRFSIYRVAKEYSQIYQCL